MKATLIVIANLVLFALCLKFLFQKVIRRYKGTNSVVKMPMIMLLIITTLIITFTSGVGALLNEQTEGQIDADIKVAMKKNDELAVKVMERDKEEVNMDNNLRVVECCIGYVGLGIAFLIRKSIDKEKMGYVKERWDMDKVK